MKEKKFPVIPAVVLGIAVVVGGVLVTNKPLVGTNEEIYTIKEAEAKAAQEKEALTKISGSERESPSSAQLAAEMKGAVKTNMGLRDNGKGTQSMLEISAPTKVEKVPVNEAAPHSHWAKEEFGMKSKDKK